MFHKGSDSIKSKKYLFLVNLYWSTLKISISSQCSYNSGKTVLVIRSWIAISFLLGKQSEAGSLS